jgi:ABC-type uncharacterized transport system permease subunit
MRIARLHCFQHVRWEPDREELRRFAVSMLIGFFALGLVVAWRRHALEPPTWVLWGLGLSLAVGSLTPGLGRMVYLGVYLPTSLIGYVLSYILLTLMFFLMFTPLGLLLRCMGKDFLQRRRPANRTVWTTHTGASSSNSYYRQF